MTTRAAVRRDVTEEVEGIPSDRQELIDGEWWCWVSMPGGWRCVQLSALYDHFAVGRNIDNEKETTDG